MFFGQMNPRTHILDNYSVEHRFDGWIKKSSLKWKNEKILGCLIFRLKFLGA